MSGTPLANMSGNPEIFLTLFYVISVDEFPCFQEMAAVVPRACIKATFSLDQPLEHIDPVGTNLTSHPSPLLYHSTYFYLQMSLCEGTEQLHPAGRR